MKFKGNLFLGLLMLIVFTISFNIHAQNKEKITKDQLRYLTEKQKKLLKEQQALIDKTKALFKESLNEDQLAKLTDRSITKEQRAKLLRASLTKKQINIISEDKKVLKAKRLAFRNSLTKKQKIRLRHFIHDRKVNDRRRLVRRLRRLIRDNIDQ